MIDNVRKFYTLDTVIGNLTYNKIKFRWKYEEKKYSTESESESGSNFMHYTLKMMERDNDSIYDKKLVAQCDIVIIKASIGVEKIRNQLNAYNQDIEYALSSFLEMRDAQKTIAKAGEKDYLGYIDLLYVNEKYRHNGIATYILDNFNHLFNKLYDKNIIYSIIMPVITNVSNIDDKFNYFYTHQASSFTDEDKALLEIMVKNLKKNKFKRIGYGYYLNVPIYVRKETVIN